MEKYTNDEVKNLELKLGDCLYSLNRRTFFLVEMESRLKTDASEAYKFLFSPDFPDEISIRV